MNATIERLTRALAGHDPREAERDEPFKEAAVALVLRPVGEADAELLLIRRATRDGDPWSGQVGLPGGNRSQGDVTLEDTAIRVTSEELGVDLRTHGTRLGVLDELRPRIVTLPPIIVRPFAWLLAGSPDPVMSDELAEYGWVSLAALFAPATRVRTSVEARNVRMEVEALRAGDFTIWGMTERILASLQAIIA